MNNFTLAALIVCGVMTLPIVVFVILWFKVKSGDRELS